MALATAGVAHVTAAQQVAQSDAQASAQTADQATGQTTGQASDASAAQPAAGTGAAQTQNGAAPVETLPAVTVSATRPAGTLAPAYAGGQVATGARVGFLGQRDVMDTPFSVTSYTSDTIANQQARDLSDVLDNDASVRNVWGQGSYTNVFKIRGFTVWSTDVSWDGLYGVLPLALIGPDTAERVEIIHGLTGLLSGISPTGGIGASINVEPKRATDAPITSVTLDYMSDSTFGTHVDVGRRFGDENQWGIRFNGTFRDGDTSTTDQSQRLGDAVLGLDYRGNGFRASLDAGYQNDKFDAPVQPVYADAGISIPAAPKATDNFYPSWSYYKAQDTFAAAHAEYDLSSNWTAFAAVGERTTQVQQLATQPTLTSSTGDTAINPYFWAQRQDTYTATTGIRGNFDTGPVNHQFTVSGSYYHQEGGSSIAFPGAVSSNIYNPASLPAPNSDTFAFSTPTTSILRDSSLAVADTASILDDRIQFTAGVRDQRVNSDGFSATTGAPTTHYNETRWTPAFALLVKPIENVSVYANYIEGLQQGPTAPAGTVNAGEVFAPYVSKQVEVGTKVDFGRIMATLAVFQIEQPSGLTNPTTLVYSVDGDQRNRGIELNVVGEAAKGVRVLSGITFMNGELTNTGNAKTQGNTAPGVPHTMANLGGEWDVPFVPQLTLSGQMVYTSAEYLDNANTQQIPSWTRFDVGARYVFYRANGKPVTIRANVENVFNRAYWGNADATYGLALGAPRTFLLSAQFDF
ncbi:TonB-dependent siderophore receptor [Pararobbsia silviterrae]|uniref:TonB-dependent siderophore receptor n=1 Tax=Pararobbsia silviterrae TaxID=1792498 RepID=A0A494XZL8_9BURK|nr:TonB-dependent siderophore receptor [Pararobbsia silviterrae]